MTLEFKTFLEKQKKLPKCFQTKIRFETKLIVSEAGDAEDKFVEKAILLIEENIDNSEFGLNSLMDQLHMSQSSLYKKIKAHTGLSTTEFIRSVRLKNAARIILEKKPKKMVDVALDVGFNDYRYFKKLFKKHFGCLPSEYKHIVLKKIYDRMISREKERSYSESFSAPFYTAPPVEFLNELIENY